MSMKYLGETFDIHAGGIDLVFPHHENEIAQSEGATGKQFARYWLHAEHLKVEGETMSKSKGNYYTFRDLTEKGFNPTAIRYLLLSVPYRKQLNFTFEGLRGAEKTVEALRDVSRASARGAHRAGLERRSCKAAAARALEEFEAGMDDDLNTSVALAAIHNLTREVNTALDCHACCARTTSATSSRSSNASTPCSTSSPLTRSAARRRCPASHRRAPGGAPPPRLRARRRDTRPARLRAASRSKTRATASAGSGVSLSEPPAVAGGCV